MFSLEDSVYNGYRRLKDLECLMSASESRRELRRELGRRFFADPTDHSVAMRYADALEREGLTPSLFHEFMHYFMIPYDVPYRMGNSSILFQHCIPIYDNGRRGSLHVSLNGRQVQYCIQTDFYHRTIALSFSPIRLSELIKRIVTGEYKIVEDHDDLVRSVESFFRKHKNYEVTKSIRFTDLSAPSSYRKYPLTGEAKEIFDLLLEKEEIEYSSQNEGFRLLESNDLIEVFFKDNEDWCRLTRGALPEITRPHTHRIDLEYSRNHTSNNFEVKITRACHQDWIEFITNFPYPGSVVSGQHSEDQWYDRVNYDDEEDNEPRRSDYFNGLSGLLNLLELYDEEIES